MIDQWRNPEAIKIAQSDWPRRVVDPTRVPGVAAGWVPMRCRECAADVAAAARVCSRCGAPIGGQPPVVADTMLADMVVGAVSDTAVSDAAGKDGYIVGPKDGPEHGLGIGASASTTG